MDHKEKIILELVPAIRMIMSEKTLKSGSFVMLDQLKETDPEKITASIRKWILKEGAVSVGFTKTEDYHWYTEVGRGVDFGKEAQLPHSHALAFTVEMDKELMDTAPHAPTVMESARQYLNAGMSLKNVT